MIRRVGRLSEWGQRYVSLRETCLFYYCGNSAGRVSIGKTYVFIRIYNGCDFQCFVWTDIISGIVYPSLLSTFATG